MEVAPDTYQGFKDEKENGFNSCVMLCCCCHSGNVLGSNGFIIRIAQQDVR